MQTAKSITTSTGKKIPFLEYVPANPSGRLIIFLHGIGEKGNPDGSNLSSLKSGSSGWLPNVIERGLFNYNFTVLSPQLDTALGDWPSYYVSEMISYAKTNLLVDPNRIYLTGLSLGGGGVWNATGDPAVAPQLAGIAPVCGTGRYSGAVGSSIKTNNIGVWAFHAANDGTVSPYFSDNAVSDLIIKGVPTLYTKYTDGSHGIWNRAYDPAHTDYPVIAPGLQKQTVQNMYEWMQTLAKGSVPVPPTPQPGAPVINNFGTDEIISGNSIVIDVSASTNVKPFPQSIDAYVWDFEVVSGSWDAQATPSGKYGGTKKSWLNLKPGVYKISLGVKGTNGTAAMAKKTITLTAGAPSTVTILGIEYSDGSTYSPTKQISSVVINYKDGSPSETKT